MTDQARLFGRCLLGSVLVHAAALAMRFERPPQIARPETTAVVWRLSADSERSSAALQAARPAVREPAGATTAAAAASERTVVRAEQPPAAEDATTPAIRRMERTPEPHSLPAAEKATDGNGRTIVRSAPPAKEGLVRPAKDSKAPAESAPAADPAPRVAATPGSAVPPRTGEVSLSAAPAASASLPGAPAPAAEHARGADRTVRASYEQVLAAWIERHKFYPLLALRRREEGTVRLRIAIDRDGRVVKTDVREGSRVASLDRAALEIVRRADPFPAPPAELAGEGFEFVVPIEFSLAKR